MEQVRQQLGMRHVIRVCSSAEHAKVMAAAERLLEHADIIRQSGINLAGMALPENEFACHSLLYSEAGPLLTKMSEAFWLGHACRHHQDQWDRVKHGADVQAQA